MHGPSRTRTLNLLEPNDALLYSSGLLGDPAEVHGIVLPGVIFAPESTPNLQPKCNRGTFHIPTWLLPPYQPDTVPKGDAIYEVRGVFYCGRCHERLSDCDCFDPPEHNQELEDE